MAEFPAVLTKDDRPTRVVYTPVELVQLESEGYVLQAEAVELPDPPQYPNDFNVAGVNAYLANADDDEKDRVLIEERNNKARSGILDGPHA